jgi:hypothetical protein
MRLKAYRRARLEQIRHNIIKTDLKELGRESVGLIHLD